MIFHPWRRQEPLDRTELARLLPAPGDPVLPDDRQRLLEDCLMNHVIEDSRRAGTRRRLAVRLAVPVALAAAVAGTALAVDRSTAPTASPGTAAADRHFPQHISSAAYTLDREPHGTVTVTVRGAGAARPDPARLQRDLERMGVPARVYQADPSCKPREGDDAGLVGGVTKAIDFRHRDGAFIAVVHPREIPAGTHLQIALSSAAKGSLLADSGEFALRKGKGPDCIPEPVLVRNDVPTALGAATSEADVPPGHRS